MNDDVNDHAGQRRRLIDWPSLAMALLPLAAIAVDTWGIVYYRQGRANEMMDFAPSVLAVALVLSSAIAGLLVRGWMLIKRGDSRSTFIGLLLPLVLIIWPAMCAMRPRPIEQYRRGLADWAAERVDVEAVRAWHATMQPVAAPRRLASAVAVPPGVWKPPPSLVEQHVNGILLQWGTREIMPGRERKIFIAIDDTTQPPDEGRRFWRAARPGVFVGAHGPP